MTIFFFYGTEDFYIFEIYHYPTIKIVFMIIFLSIPNNRVLFS